MKTWLDKHWTEGSYLVIGDVMVDEYAVGIVSRISPEAPVPVFEFQNYERAPGGAANAAINLRALGNHVELVGVVGDDEPGQWLLRKLREHGVGTAGIVVDKERPTTRKVRFATHQQSVLRVDYERSAILDPVVAEQVAAHVRNSLTQTALNGVLVSDYNKGVIPGYQSSSPLLPVFQKLVKMPLVTGVDTKKTGQDLRIFRDFDFIKPNRAELERAVGFQIREGNSREAACRRYLRLCRAKSVLVTLSDDGMAHFDGVNSFHVPVAPTTVRDVTGAGDTVLSVVMHALACGLNWKHTMRLANVGASVVVESPGTHALTRDELIRRVEWVEHTRPDYFIADSDETHL